MAGNHDHELVPSEKRSEGIVRAVLPTTQPNELNLGADEIDIGRKEPAPEGAVPDGLLGNLGSQQDMINGRVEASLLHAEPRRRVTLRVQIDQERGTLGQPEAGSEVDRRGGFPHAALLIHYRNGSGNQLPP